MSKIRKPRSAPAALAVGLLVSALAAAGAAGIFAVLIGNGKIPEQMMKFCGIPVSVIAVLSGCLSVSVRTDRKLLLCIGLSAVYLLMQAVCNILFCRAGFRNVPITAASVFGTGILMGIAEYELQETGKKHRRKKKIC